MQGANIVSWIAMIEGYAQNGVLKKVIKIFNQMQVSYVKFNFATLAIFLLASTTMGALK